MICHFSFKAAQIFGNNAVPVLCTIVLMSYMKILHNIVTGLGVATVYQFHSDHDSTGDTRVVWLLDGNVPYCGRQHAALFAVTLLICLIWITYTFVLLLQALILKYKVPFISTLLDTKLMPVREAYNGPLNHKHHYWVGLTLLVRFFVAVAAISFGGLNPNVSIVLVGFIVTFLCILVKNVFKDFHIFVLESSFLVHLTVLCFAFLATNNDETRVVLMCVSISIAFLVFVVIVLCSVFNLLKLKSHFNQHREGYEQIGDRHRGSGQVNARDQTPPVTSTVVPSPSHKDTTF